MGMLGQVLLVTAAAGIGGTGLGGGAACLFRRDSSRMVSLLLSFAAGAMLYVVAEELLPRAGSRRGTCGFLVGFLFMMVLDVALG